MVQHRGWNQSLCVTEWWVSKEHIKERSEVIHLLSEYAIIDFGKTQSILDQNLDRRILYEVSGKSK